ncbi:MAG: hypothetical protein ACK8QZ_05380, partial [Anaerolineales bacterium]
SDLKDCLDEIIQRTGKYPPLSHSEFETLYRLATELEEVWSYLDAEKRLGINFFANSSIHHLLEMGVIRWQAGLFYTVEASIRELLLEIHALSPAQKEDVL